MIDTIVPIRIAIVGAGAMGGFYGAKLAHVGYDVHFLMQRDYETVRRKGLTVKSCQGDFHLSKINCYRDVKEIGKVDLVFIGLKTTANHLYQELIDPLVSPQTLVLTAQNGLGNVEILAQLVGPERVAGGLAFLCSNRREKGVIEHLDYGLIHIGNYHRPPDDKLHNFGQMLRNSGVDCVEVEDLELAQWKKLIWNVPFNGLSAALDKRVDEIITDTHLKTQAEKLMQEVQSAARANGLMIEDNFLTKMIADTEKMASYYTSMHLDKRAGRETEFEAIIAEPLRRGRLKGLKLSAMSDLYRKLSQC
jgi:2-dehydropantoate 2-reductase